MSPKASVIIPAYNAGEFIDCAIRSVLAQSYGEEIEIIVIDDGSSDDTREIVEDLARQHPRLVCVPNERSKGPSGARNTGLLKAAGEYIAFLDADDLWLPHHLESGISFLERHAEVDAVFYNFELIDYRTKLKIGDWFNRHRFSQMLDAENIENYKLIRSDMFNALIEESFIHLQSMVVRRKALKGILFNEDICRSEDRDFCIKMYIYSNAQFAFNDMITGIYHRRDNSLTSETIDALLATAMDHIKIFTFYLACYQLKDSTRKKLKQLLYEKYVNASYYFRKLNAYRESAMSLCKSLNYKVTIYQFRELAKIVVAFLIWCASAHKRPA